MEYQEIQNTWNLFAEEWSLNKVRSLSATRKQKVRDKLKIKDFDLKEILKKSEECAFLMGVGARGWAMSFEFVFCNLDSWLYILEGKYSNQERFGDRLKLDGIMESLKTLRRLWKQDDAPQPTIDKLIGFHRNIKPLIVEEEVGAPMSKERFSSIKKEIWS